MAKAKSKKETPGIQVVPDNRDSRNEAFQKALEEAKATYGEGAVQRITKDVIDKQKELEEDIISTGIPQVDRITTRGGLLRGIIVEVIGPESSGKTTLCLHTIAEVQKAGGTVLYIDMEHALQKPHVHNCGIKELDIMQPDSGEEALDLAESFARAGTDLIVVDSVAALVPRDELDGKMGDFHVGKHARLMSQALRKLTGVAAKNRSTIIFINQIRHKIGVMFGSPETTTGGNALKFYSSIRFDMRRKEQVKMGNDVVGNMIRAKVIKNKTGAPYNEETLYMFFDANRTVAANAIDFGSKIGVVGKSGSWYSYKEERIGQGVVNAVNFMVEHPDMLDEILKECRKNLFKPIVGLDDVI